MNRIEICAKYVLLLLVGAMVIGCAKSSDSKTSADSKTSSEVSSSAAKPAPTPDNEETLAELSDLGAKTKTDGDGLVIEVDFRGTAVNDDLLSQPHGLLQLGGLSRVRSVLLGGTDITDAGLVAIGKLQTLTNLDLRDCAVTNDGMGHLVGLSKLKALKLSGKNGATLVDDGGLEHIAKLANLKVIGLDFLWVSEVGLEELSKLSKLEEVYIGNTTIGDDAMSILAEMPNLKKLRISATGVGDEGIAHLASVTGLTELDVSENTVITSASFPHFAKFTGLKKLNLWRLNNVTDIDIALEHIAGLTNLEWLNLDNTQLTDAGTVHLAGLTNLTFLHLGSTALSDKGLVNLEGLKSLEDLKVTRTTVTEEGVATLQEKLPNTAIQLEYEGGRQ